MLQFFLGIRWDAPAGVTQEEGHIGVFLFPHLPSAVLTLIFIARKTQPPLSFVDCVKLNFVRESLRSCDYAEIRTHVPTSEGSEVTN